MGLEFLLIFGWKFSLVFGVDLCKYLAKGDFCRIISLKFSRFFGFISGIAFSISQNGGLTLFLRWVFGLFVRF